MNPPTHRPLAELIDSEDPAWPMVQTWTQGSKNAVALLPADRPRAARVLEKLQITTHSSLGAIAYETGGVLVDSGWIRLLGGGCERFRSDLADWNGLSEAPVVSMTPGAFIVGYDAIGGFFATDHGALGPGDGNVFYFAPDSLEWEDMERGYSDFLQYLAAGDLDGFYAGYRWATWREDAEQLDADRGFLLLPPLWTKEGKDLQRQHRKDVPMHELWGVQMAFRKQLLEEHS